MRRYAEGEWPGHAAGGVTEEFTLLLSAVIGYAERVRGSVEPEHEVQPYLSGILGSAVHALSLSEPHDAEGDANVFAEVLQRLQQESDSLREMVERMHEEFPDPEEPDEAEDARGNILVVHRDRYIRRAYASTLADLGFRVWQQESGWDAVQAVIQNSRRIDLLIAEADMPLLSGDDIASILRSANSGMRVVLISGGDPPPLGVKIVHAGADAVLANAYSLKSLILEVEGLFVG